MGIAGKHVFKAFGPYKDIKVRSVATPLVRFVILKIWFGRFAGVVYPGETIVTEMWKEGSKVIFSKTLYYETDRKTSHKTNLIFLFSGQGEGA